jgi:hypothetical protein
MECLRSRWNYNLSQINQLDLTDSLYIVKFAMCRRDSKNFIIDHPWKRLVKWSHIKWLIKKKEISEKKQGFKTEKEWFNTWIQEQNTF